MAGSGALALAGCRTGRQGAPPAPAPREFSPIGFRVSRITLEDRYSPPGQAPNLDHELAPTPAQALADWAARRLVAEGGPGSLAAVIEDASLVAEALPVEGGLVGLMREEPSDRYVLHLAASLAADEAAGGGSARAEATVTQTVLESTGEAERAALWRDMLTTALAEFDRRMETEIRSNLAPLLA